MNKVQTFVYIMEIMIMKKYVYFEKKGISQKILNLNWIFSSSVLNSVLIIVKTGIVFKKMWVTESITLLSN